MTNDKEQPRVVLIYGDPGSGKSHLAEQMRDNYGYHLVELDHIYYEFIKAQYSGLFLPDLMLVVAQHYRCFLQVLDRAGYKEYQGAVSAWGDWVASLAEDASGQYSLVAIEGYLLRPILETVRQRLGGKAIVRTVEVLEQQYFVNGVVKSLEQICG